MKTKNTIKNKTSKSNIYFICPVFINIFRKIVLQNP